MYALLLGGRAILRLGGKKGASNGAVCTKNKECKAKKCKQCGNGKKCGKAPGTTCKRRKDCCSLKCIKKKGKKKGKCTKEQGTSTNFVCIFSLTAILIKFYTIIY